MLATAKALTKVLESEKRSHADDFAPYWTMLVLSPSGFFEKPPEPKPEPTTDVWEKAITLETDWKTVRSQPIKIAAEVACIVYALKEVVKRWTNLNEYISKLLMEDVMDPEVYVQLLFDDETFSRSRLYFWVIGCLNEFEVSIADNIKQWELFRLARVMPALASNNANLSVDNSQVLPLSSGSQSDQNIDSANGLVSLDREAEELRESLEYLRGELRNKLRTVEILRSGVSHLFPPFDATVPLVPTQSYLASEPALTTWRCLAFQRQCSDREQNVDKTRPKRKAPNLRQHLLSTISILRCKISLDLAPFTNYLFLPSFEFQLKTNLKSPTGSLGHPQRHRPRHQNPLYNHCLRHRPGHLHHCLQPWQYRPPLPIPPF